MVEADEQLLRVSCNCCWANNSCWNRGAADAAAVPLVRADKAKTK
jgi:hypothetical protein